MSISPRSSLTFVGLLFAALLATGCEKKIAAVCEEKCGADAEKCVTASEAAEATAEERGCEGEFEEYASCAESKATCKDGVLDTKGCEAEIKALATCTK